MKSPTFKGQTYYDKFGLGYKQTHTEKGSSSMMTKREEEQKSYAEFIRGPIKKEEGKSSKKRIQEMERTQEEYYRRATPRRRSKT
jgi:hypothetical protein